MGAAFALPLQPLLGLMRLAVRAVTVTTRVRNKALFATVCTVGLHFGAHGTTTGFNGIQHLAVDGLDFALAITQEVGLEGINNVREPARKMHGPNHLTRPQLTMIESISLLMRAWGLLHSL